MTTEQLLAEKTDHEGRLAQARSKLADAQANVSALTSLVLRLEGAVLAVSALLEKAEPGEPKELPACA